MEDEGPASAETTRDQLLASARSLVLDRFRDGVAAHHALAYLTPAAVARRAGVSRGTIYHYWGGADHDTDDRPFQRFLAEVAQLLWDDAVSIDDLGELASMLPDNLTDLTLELTAYEFTRLTTGDDAVMFRASTTMALHGVDLSAQFDRTVGDLAAAYDVALVRLGRRVRPPLELRDLARTVASLTAGMLIDELFAPGSAMRPIDWTGSSPRLVSERDWTLFAIAAESIMLNMTEPIPPPEQAASDEASSH